GLRTPRSTVFPYTTLFRSALGRGDRARVPSLRRARRVRHWLLKSEPDVFGIDDLAAAPRKTTYWDGVRNYQARNFLRDQMKRGRSEEHTSELQSRENLVCR